MGRLSGCPVVTKLKKEGNIIKMGKHRLSKCSWCKRTTDQAIGILEKFKQDIAFIVTDSEEW